MVDRKELEDWDALLRSDGWQRFAAHVQRLWGSMDSGGGTYFQKAVSDATKIGVSDDALAHLRQITAAQREIHSLMAYPKAIVDRLKGPTVSQEFVGSRRGTL